MKRRSGCAKSDLAGVPLDQTGLALPELLEAERTLLITVTAPSPNRYRPPWPAPDRWSAQRAKIDNKDSADGHTSASVSTGASGHRHLLNHEADLAAGTPDTAALRCRELDVPEVTRRRPGSPARAADPGLPGCREVGCDAALLPAVALEPRHRHRHASTRSCTMKYNKVRKRTGRSRFRFAGLSGATLDTLQRNRTCTS